MVIRMTKEIRHFSKNKNLHLILSIIMTVLSAFIQVYVIQVFMNPCNLLSSGFTGVAILIHKICNLFNINFSISLGILMLNIPAALMCYKSVSKRFVFLSCLQFGLVSFFFNIFSFTPFFDDLVLNVLFGGFLYGIGITLALKADGSTGGTDFIALYISNKIHKSLWDYVFIFNTIILIIFGLFFGWVYAGYSIIFQFISTQTISRFYHRYAQITVEITTENPDIITKAYTENFKHGMSVIDAYGAYSNKKFYICKTVISSYEEADVIDCVLNVAPNVIINSYKTNHFYGKFYHQPIG